MPGTFGGVLILGLINNLLNLYNVQSYYQQILKGAIILFANTILGRLIFLLIPTVMIFFYEPVTKFFRNISKEQ